MLSARSVGVRCPIYHEEMVVTRIAQLEPTRVTVGVDTHRDAHVAVALDQLGRRLGQLEIARQEFEKRFGELDSATREAMLRVIEGGYAPEKYDEQLLDCPACGTPALVFGSVKVEMDEDWDHHEGVLIGVHPYFTFIPNRLRCSACGIELDGRDELDAAGIAEPWPLEDVDERDFFGGDEEW